MGGEGRTCAGEGFRAKENRALLGILSPQEEYDAAKFKRFNGHITFDHTALFRTHLLITSPPRPRLSLGVRHRLSS